MLTALHVFQRGIPLKLNMDLHDPRARLRPAAMLGFVPEKLNCSSERGIKAVSRFP